MANEQNLLPGGTYKFTDADRAKARKARIERASRRRALREALEELLSRDYEGPDGSKVPGVEAIAVAVMKKALEGDLEAFRIIRDTVGEKPVERVISSDIDPRIIEEVEFAVLGE